MHNVNQRLRDQQASLLLKGVAPLEVVLSAFHTGSKKKKKNRRRWSTRGFSVCIYIYMRDVILLFFLLIILYFFLCLSLFTFRHHTHVLMTRAQTYMDRRDALYSNAEGALRAFCWGYTRTHRFFRLINLLCSKRRTFFRSSLSTYIYNLFWTFSFRHFFPCPRRL